MAEHSLMFKIGSAFEGEGFKKVKQEIGEVNTNIKASIGVAGRLSGAFGEMDTKAAKMMTAVSGLAQAILSFNVTAIATQAVMTAINMYFGHLREKAEEAKKAADDLKASLEKVFSKTLTSQMDEFNAAIEKIEGDFDRVTKSANAFTAALEGVRGSVATGGIINLEIEKVNAMLEAHSEEERATIEATHNLRIAIQKSADSEAEWQAKTEAAHDAVVQNKQRIAKYDDEILEAAQRRAQLEEQMETAKMNADEHWVEIQKTVNEMKKKEAELTEKRNAAMDEGDVLIQKEKKAIQDSENARAKSTLEIDQARLAEQKLREQIDERRMKEVDVTNATQEEVSFKKLGKSVYDEMIDAQNELNKASNELKKAEEEYANKLREYNDPANLARLAAQQYVKDGGKAGILPVDVQKSVQFAVADQVVSDAIKNGVVNTVKDADRLQRQAMREARDAISKEQRDQLAEEKKANRIRETGEKARSKQDKEWLKRYEQIQKEREKRKQELADAKTKMEAAQEKAQASLDKLKDIQESLGEKGSIASKLSGIRGDLKDALTVN